MREKLEGYIDYILFRLGLYRKRGWTTFAPLTIAPEYTNIDLQKKQVTGVVNYNDKVYLTVFVDVKTGKTKGKGSLRGITKITKPFKKRNYIEIIKNEAEFFIENGITNPEEYDKNR